VGTSIVVSAELALTVFVHALKVGVVLIVTSGSVKKLIVLLRTVYASKVSATAIAGGLEQLARPRQMWIARFQSPAKTVDTSQQGAMIALVHIFGKAQTVGCAHFIARNLPFPIMIALSVNVSWVKGVTLAIVIIPN